MLPSVVPSPAINPENWFDGRGLYLEVTPRGGKYWRLKYRFGGKEKRTLPGSLSLTFLSKKLVGAARTPRRLLTQEIDPSEYRQARKAARVQQASNSFEAVAA